MRTTYSPAGLAVRCRPVPAGAGRAAECAAAAACQERPDAEIQRAGQTLVEPVSGQRAATPLCCAGQIDEGQAHRLEALVGIPAGQVNHRKMGLDSLDPAGRMGIGGRTAQRAIDPPLGLPGRAAAEGERQVGRVRHAWSPGAARGLRAVRGEGGPTGGPAVARVPPAPRGLPAACTGSRLEP
ncbi:hypothetical protein ACVCIC_11140 [Burkholderia glumae]|uniref:hypothetical protein n=1 Tax=Burkholderia glumae TaxID=337 RepID=UPI001FD72DB6|nr:hypothetical protein [Burkholderia glumae]MCM2484441.1 hypothetical protein [Burkholderia glumae]MCM2510133.1 hypothetical protein [Burkholderia glumae]